MIRRDSHHHRIRRLHRPVRKTEPAKREKIATPVNSAPNHSVEFAKLAINLMFLANGGSATTILVNMDIDKFFAPLSLFSTGILISMLMAVSLIFDMHNIVRKYKIDRSTFSISGIIIVISRTIAVIIYSVFFILPCLFFLIGMSSMQYIITMKDNPTLGSIVNFLIDMSFKAVQ